MVDSRISIWNGACSEGTTAPKIRTIMMNPDPVNAFPRHSLKRITMGGLLTLCVLAATGWHPLSAEEAQPEKDVFKTGLEQPTVIPGSWRLMDQPYPPLKEVISQPRTRRPVYGLYCWASEYVRYHDFIKQVGFPNLRCSGPFNDKAFRLMVEDGIEVMHTISARIHGTFKPEAPMSDWRNRADYESDEAFIEDFCLGIERFLKRYGPEGSFFTDNPDLPHRPVRHIEIFNEPNFWYLDVARNDKANRYPTPENRLETENNRARLYGKLLVAAYDRVKKQWPEVKVVGFAAGGTSKADIAFIQKVHAFNPEVANSYDILSTHPYVRPVPPEATFVKSWGSYSIASSLDTIRATMQQYGTQERPVWYTELNWTIFPEVGGAYALDPDPAKQRDVSPELQAAYIVRGYLLALRLGVERVTYMSIVDTDNVNSGMLDRNNDNAWRPSAHAVDALLELMPFPKLVGRHTEGEDGVYGYLYSSDPTATAEGQGDILVFWKVDGPGEMTLRWGKGVNTAVTLVDMLGNRYEAPVVDGRLTFEIGPLPVYILR